MHRAGMLVATWLGAAMALLPGAATAGDRAGGGWTGFRSPGAFHSLDGLAGSYRTPGRYFARDSVASPVARHRLPTQVGSGASALWLAAPSAVYAPAAVEPPVVEVSVAPVTQVFSTVYLSPPGAAAPPAAPQPPAPALPTVVEYATGRYELRGDGLASPYVWVWIPNPPPAPPPAPPSPPATREEAEPRVPTQVFRWTDEDGVLHLTNRPEALPEPRRSLVDEPGPSESTTSPPTSIDEASGTSSARLAIRPPAPPRPGS